MVTLRSLLLSRIGKLSQVEIMKKPLRVLTARQSLKLWSLETKQLLSTLELKKNGINSSKYRAAVDYK